MREIVSLTEVQHRPVPEVVDLLRQMLAKAERGEIIGIAIAATTTGRCTASGFALGQATIADLHLASARIQLRLLDHEG